MKELLKSSLSFLVEDCRWEFKWVDDKLTAWDPDSEAVMTFDPNSTSMDVGSGWTEAYSSTRAGWQGP